VLLIGPPGVGKTYAFRQAVAEAASGHYGYLNNHATPFGLYARLWGFLDVPIIIDDIRALVGNRRAVSLLLSACDTGKPKVLTWTARGVTAESSPPSKFVTTSNIAIITNIWNTLQEQVHALENRCLCYHFQPTVAEVHKYVGTWFDDSDVYEWVGRRIFLADEPNIRSYLAVKTLKNSGVKDWEKQVEAVVGINERLSLVLRLEFDKTLTRDDRIAEFMKLTGKSKATYERDVIEVRKRTPAEPMSLLRQGSLADTLRERDVLEPIPTNKLDDRQLAVLDQIQEQLSGAFELPGF